MDGPLLTIHLSHQLHGLLHELLMLLDFGLTLFGRVASLKASSRTMVSIPAVFGAELVENAPDQDRWMILQMSHQCCPFLHKVTLIC